MKSHIEVFIYTILSFTKGNKTILKEKELVKNSMRSFEIAPKRKLIFLPSKDIKILCNITFYSIFFNKTLSYLCISISSSFLLPRVHKTQTIRHNIIGQFHLISHSWYCIIQKGNNTKLLKKSGNAGEQRNNFFSRLWIIIAN